MPKTHSLKEESYMSDEPKEETREKVDRIKFQVLGCKPPYEPELTIDVPSYFKVDAERLWAVLLSELMKQEKAAEEWLTTARENLLEQDKKEQKEGKDGKTK